MKKEIKRLIKILKSRGFSPKETAGIIVYVMVVFMAKSPKKVAKRFGIAEDAIMQGVIKVSAKLNSDKVFYVKMHETMKVYFLMNNLKKLAS